MAVPTYEELLAHCNVDGSVMEQIFSDDHLIEFGSQLDEWEKLALSLRIPIFEIVDIKSQGGKGMSERNKTATVLETEVWIHGHKQSFSESTASH